MLHRIQLCPHCEKILMAVLRLQEAILVYACGPASEWPPSVADFPGIPPTAAQWFIGKLQRGAKLTKFGTTLKALCDHVRDDPLVGQEIVDAFRNDVKFPNSVNDPGFEFQFALRLDAATQKILKELMVLFYETLAGANFPGAVHGEVEDFTRDLLLEGFERANPKLQVCPACDGQKPSKIEAKLLADADHYLPKSLYPFLAVHPGNLVPLCLECNQRIKGDTDPVLDHAATPLTNIFLPYVVPAAEHLELRISRDGSKGLAIDFQDKSAPGSRRVESLQAIFALNKRWPGRLDQQKNSVVDIIIETGYRRRQEGSLISETALMDLLEPLPNEAQRKTGRTPFYLINRSYKDFVLLDEAERKQLLAQFEGT